jgi:hypothetical protein
MDGKGNFILQNMGHTNTPDGVSCLLSHENIADKVDNLMVTMDD